MNDYLLSIVIPTRNRPKKLSYALNSILKYQDFAQLIVVSNGDSMEMDVPKEFLDNSKINFFRSDDRLSMSKNWLYGFQYVAGEWVYYLGDDDLMVLNSEDLYKSLSNSGSNGVRFKPSFFDWKDNCAPDLEFNNSNYKPLKFVELRNDSKNFWIFKNVNGFPSGAGTSIVRKTFMDKLNNSEMLFRGISPDWSNAAHFSILEKKYEKSDQILTCIGKSGETSINFFRNPKSEISNFEIPLLSREKSSELIQLQMNCPTFWLSRVDSLVQSRKNLGLNYKVSKFLLVLSGLNTTPKYVVRMVRYFYNSKFGRIEILFLAPIMQLYSINRWFYRKILIMVKSK
jgi:glycosyltransferase involved in cell wall biosynthesis